MSIEQTRTHLIEQCPDEYESPYTAIPNALIRDASLSPECRWLLIYLLSNASGWKIRVAQIAAHLKGMCGRDKVYRILNEAIEAGYMKKEFFLIPGMLNKSGMKNIGKYRSVRYLVSRTPKFKKCLLHPCFQDADAKGPQNPHAKELLSTYEVKNYQEERREAVASPPLCAKTSSPQKKERAPNVSTSEEEHSKLAHPHGEEVRDMAYTVLSEWKSDKPKSKWRKSDYLSIIRWGFDAALERIAKSNKSINHQWVRINDEFAGKAMYHSKGLLGPIMQVKPNGVNHKLKDKYLSYNMEPMEFQRQFTELFRLR